jgi:hypothetical protein
MKECPYCWIKFNWWIRATGQYKEHVRECHKSKKSEEDLSRAYTCRGCPAGCFEEYDFADEKKSD